MVRYNKWALHLHFLEGVNDTTVGSARNESAEASWVALQCSFLMQPLPYSSNIPCPTECGLYQPCPTRKEHGLGNVTEFCMVSFTHLLCVITQSPSTLTEHPTYYFKLSWVYCASVIWTSFNWFNMGLQGKDPAISGFGIFVDSTPIPSLFTPSSTTPSPPIATRKSFHVISDYHAHCYLLLRQVKPKDVKVLLL